MSFQKTINPKKLLHSKWTASVPQNKEKHFIITELHAGDDELITHCTIQAVFSLREQKIIWQELNNSDMWQQGWR